MNENTSSIVSGVKLENYDSFIDIKHGVYKLLNMFENKIPNLDNAVVLLKINLCLLIGPETGATVDVRVVRSIIEWLLTKRKVREIIIAESDATQMSADIAYRALGWESCMKELENVRFLNLSKDELVDVTARRTYIKDLKMSKTYMECDWLMNVCKLKTHTEQIITCNMKNIFGAIPEKIKQNYHPRLTEAICDANAARLPDFGFIDGLISLENDGPTKGTPRRTGLLLAGNDTVALDHYAAWIMGFKPEKIPHLKEAISRGLGSSVYTVLNREIKPCNPPFEFMPLWKQAIRNIIKKLRK